MIFLTVGTQLPFDRLTAALDAWCGRTGYSGQVFGQIGKLDRPNYRPVHFPWKQMLEPGEYEQCVQDATVIVSHAGMGSIITAMSSHTPIVILPRRAALGEQRTDHQLATARRLGIRPGLLTASDADEVPGLIEQALAGDGTGGTLPPYAEDRLIRAVRNFIHDDPLEQDDIVPSTGSRSWMKKA